MGTAGNGLNPLLCPQPPPRYVLDHADGPGKQKRCNRSNMDSQPGSLIFSSCPPVAHLASSQPENA